MPFIEHIAVLFAIFQYNTVLVATYLLFCLYTTLTKKSEVAVLFFTLTGGFKTIYEGDLVAIKCQRKESQEISIKVRQGNCEALLISCLVFLKTLNTNVVTL